LGAISVLDGLQNPFGTNRKVGEFFNGNAKENIILGARALNSFFGPVTGDNRAIAAGLYKAGKVNGPGYTKRVAIFKSQAKNKNGLGYDAFFSCLKDKGY